jgi:hypothetical protein
VVSGILGLSLAAMGLSLFYSAIRLLLADGKKTFKKRIVGVRGRVIHHGDYTSDITEFSGCFRGAYLYRIGHAFHDSFVETIE